MVLLEAKEYDRARFIWCTTVLGKPETGEHDLYGSVESNLCDGCPALFSFKTSFELQCGSDFCPTPHAVSSNSRQPESGGVGKLFTQVHPPAYCKRFTQEALEVFFSEHNASCEMIATEEHVADKPMEAFRSQPFLSEELTVIGEEFCCAGTRRYLSRNTISYPVLLHVACPVGDNESSQMIQNILVGDKEYVLAALIYSINHKTHFSWHMFVRGRPLYYDGMTRPVLRWHSLAEYQRTTHPISHIWYLRANREIANTCSSSSSGDQSSESQTKPSKRQRRTLTPVETAETIKAKLLPPKKKEQKKISDRHFCADRRHERSIADMRDLCQNKLGAATIELCIEY